MHENYSSFNSNDKIKVNKSIVVNGNNHEINANDHVIFEITDNINVTFKNITFKNGKYFLNNSIYANVTFLNCYFKLDDFSSNNELVAQTQVSYGYSGSISPTVKKLAESIVGKSEGIKAAKKLAKWVGSNFGHEARAGFYQSPDVTLERKTGNCCSLTDLFLQMCVAVGVDKNHKLCFAHTGYLEFTHRHFFATIDNICVDVGSKPYSPWGHALFMYNVIYTITEYPLLPLPRNY